MNQSPEVYDKKIAKKSKRPIPVLAISWLMIGLSAFVFLTLAWSLIIARKSSRIDTVEMIATLAVFALVYGIIVLLAVFLLKMQKWVIYAYTLALGLNIPLMIYDSASGTVTSKEVYWGSLFLAALVVYLWIIRKKFN